jgi:hypothetical protein
MEVINICDLDLDSIYGGVDPYSDEGIKLFKQYCLDNDCYFYAYSKECYNLPSAMFKAQARGFSKIIVEDLS